jgi:FSR family fosmidomycin resistance protein-like MFS transporter
MSVANGTDSVRTDPAVPSSKRRNLVAACLAHALHDGYTDGLYAFLPVWQEQFGLSYAGLATLRALYYGTMGGLQVPADRLTRGLSLRAALVLSTLVAAAGFVVMALPLGYAGLCSSPRPTAPPLGSRSGSTTSRATSERPRCRRRSRCSCRLSPGLPWPA